MRVNYIGTLFRQNMYMIVWQGMGLQFYTPVGMLEILDEPGEKESPSLIRIGGRIDNTITWHV